MVASRPSKDSKSRTAKTVKRAVSERASPGRAGQAKAKAAGGSGQAKAKRETDKVHVWWPPTRNKQRTGFSGAFWPAAVVKVEDSEYTVRYDNGEKEVVSSEHVFPYDVPVEFGEEEVPLQIGEFVEVSNGSTTDPCAWLARISAIGKYYTVKYPFHDTPAEKVKESLLRRARIWDENTWKFIGLGQRWKDGEVTSPLELHLLKDKEYFKELKTAAPAAKKVAKRPAKQTESDEDSDSSDDSDTEEQEPPKKKKKSAQSGGKGSSSSRASSSSNKAKAKPSKAASSKAAAGSKPTKAAAASKPSKAASLRAEGKSGRKQAKPKPTRS